MRPKLELVSEKIASLKKEGDYSHHDLVIYPARKMELRVHVCSTGVHLAYGQMPDRILTEPPIETLPEGIREALIAQSWLVTIQRLVTHKWYDFIYGGFDRKVRRTLASMKQTLVQYEHQLKRSESASKTLEKV